MSPTSFNELMAMLESSSSPLSFSSLGGFLASPTDEQRISVNSQRRLSFPLYDVVSSSSTPFQDLADGDILLEDNQPLVVHPGAAVLAHPGAATHTVDVVPFTPSGYIVHPPTLTRTEEIAHQSIEITTEPGIKCLSIV